MKSSQRSTEQCSKKSDRKRLRDGEKENYLSEGEPVRDEMGEREEALEEKLVGVMESSRRKKVDEEQEGKKRVKRKKLLVPVGIIPRSPEWWLSELGESWYEALKYECDQPYLLECLTRVELDRQRKEVYPPHSLVFNAFRLTPLSRFILDWEYFGIFRLPTVKVVIVGQDPYQRKGQAMGLSFSVPSGIKIPPSLINIYKEISADKPLDGDLTAWAQQGVLLLNSILTVEEGKPLSHKKYGWETFTNKVIEIINNECFDVVFMLWGLPSRKKGASVDYARHCVLESGHPSPLSVRHFTGGDHFNKANEFLIQRNKAPIDWRLESATS